MKTKSIRERRLDALYKYKDHSNSNSRRDLLDFLVAIIPHSLVKEVVEHFDMEH
jgi:hypothetical protein